MTPLFLPRLRLWWWRASWVLPVAAVFAGLALQNLTDQADEWLYAEGTQPFVSASAATAMLAAVGGGMVTFTGLVFSFFVLVLQFGSSQYSPRTVSLLVKNRLTQWVLALFILTITFCFVGLIEVGSQGRDDFEPQTTVLIAIVLLMASLIGFVAMLHTVGGRIRVDRVLSDIGRLARQRLHSGLLPVSEQSTASTMAARSAGAEKATEVLRFLAPPGQLIAVNTRALLRLAARHQARITLTVFVGDAVSFGSVIGRVSSPSPIPTSAVSSCLLVDLERSLRHDPLYALRLLADVAIRALSPAVNDPTTAVRSLDEIEGVLRVAAYRRLGPVELRRGAGTLVLTAPSWDDVCDLALLEIIDSGGAQPQISRRLTALLDDLEADLPEQRHSTLHRYRRLLVSYVTGHVEAEQQLMALTADRQGLGGTR